MRMSAVTTSIITITTMTRMTTTMSAAVDITTMTTMMKTSMSITIIMTRMKTMTMSIIMSMTRTAPAAATIMIMTTTIITITQTKCSPAWGIETPNTYSAEDIEKILTALDSGEYGAILRAKGMVPAPDGTWVYYDYVPEEHDIRSGKPEVTGKICVIGSKLDEDKLAELFRK